MDAALRAGPSSELWSQGRGQPFCPLHRMFAEGAREQQWSRSASLSSCCSQISNTSSSEQLRYRCFNVGTCELRRLSHTKFQRLRRCNDGHRGKCALGWSGDDGKREQRLPRRSFSCSPCSSLGSTMTGPACSARSSSDAPVCASLVRAASAKSSPLLPGLASESCVDTFLRSVTLRRHTGECLPESLCRHRLWTASLHEHQGWSLVGTREDT